MFYFWRIKLSVSITFPGKITIFKAKLKIMHFLSTPLKFKHFSRPVTTLIHWEAKTDICRCHMTGEAFKTRAQGVGWRVRRLPHCTDHCWPTFGDATAKTSVWLHLPLIKAPGVHANMLSAFCPWDNKYQLGRMHMLVTTGDCQNTFNVNTQSNLRGRHAFVPVYPADTRRNNVIKQATGLDA